MPHLRNLLLDTDIGSDVDDALALALILGMRQLRLLGVTTVYGDTVLRAQIAKSYIMLAGREEIEVIPGLRETRSGRDVWWPGHEGTRHIRLDQQLVSTDLTATEFMGMTVAANRNDIDVVGIGPLTNVASVMDASPHFERDVRGLWIMGGSFDSPKPEHNILSDIAAAQRVVQSSAPLTLLPLDVTERVQLETAQVELIASSGSVGDQLGQDIHQWWELRGTAWNVPHDPLTVLAIAHPEVFTFSPLGHVTVSEEGTTRFDADGNGTTRIATDVDVARAAELMVNGICDASPLKDAGDRAPRARR